MQTLSAQIEPTGVVTLQGDLRIDGPRRALVLVLDEPPLPAASEEALLSEDALSDWARPEEDAAWAHLQSAQ